MVFLVHATTNAILIRVHAIMDVIQILVSVKTLVMVIHRVVTATMYIMESLVHVIIHVTLITVLVTTDVMDYLVHVTINVIDTHVLVIMDAIQMFVHVIINVMKKAHRVLVIIHAMDILLVHVTTHVMDM